MKKSLIYIYTALLALAGSVSLSSCDDDFERPPNVGPTAKRHANTTIAELKTKFYTGESNYATLVEKRDDGTDYIIKGRVISSDQAGNFFKQLVIEDETGAIQVNIDSYDLYKSYQYGQEIVIDVTGLYVGAYGKLMQIGSTPNNNYPGRIASDLAAKQIEVNGLAEPEKIVAGEYTIAALNDLISNQEEFLAKQCRLVSIKDVTFKDAGKATLADKDKNTSRTISDGTGDMIVYTSGYSDFYDYYCPEGKGTIVGILPGAGATIASFMCYTMETKFSKHPEKFGTGIIDGICRPAKKPVFAGEEGICSGCGVATLSISYYDLGYTTGEMAVKILNGESDISTMPIEYTDVTKKYNKTICDDLGLTVPEGYEAIEG